MAVSEQKRHRLYNKAVDVFGEEDAVILMAHLPPGGWSNLATKQDLLDLESRLTGRFHGSLSDLKTSMLRTILTVNVAMVVVVAGVAFGAAGLR